MSRITIYVIEALILLVGTFLTGAAYGARRTLDTLQPAIRRLLQRLNT